MNGSNETNGTATQKLQPPLPLVVNPPTDEDETKMTIFKLRTTPGQADSPTYTFKMRKLDGSEDLRQGIQFAYDMPKVITGLNITTTINKKALYLQVLTGPPLQNFNNGFDEAKAKAHQALRVAAYSAARNTGRTDAEAQVIMAAVVEPADHDDFITAGLYAILTYIAPHKALAKQKRWMRCNCRKPANMSVREYTNNLRRINEREMCKLPPFGANQILTGDELNDIVLHGVPRSWPREMEKQGFDPDTKTLVEIIQFCERMEEAEDFGVGRDAQKTKTTTNKVKYDKVKYDKVKTDKKEKSSSSGDQKYCLIHGDNHTHDSDECHVLVKGAGNAPSRWQ